MKTYHFNVPKIFVWIQHVLLGIIFFVIGYQGLNGKISKNASLVLILSGALGAIYHAHIWFDHAFNKKITDHEH